MEQVLAVQANLVHLIFLQLIDVAAFTLIFRYRRSLGEISTNIKLNQRVSSGDNHALVAIADIHRNQGFVFFTLVIDRVQNLLILLLLFSQRGLQVLCFLQVGEACSVIKIGLGRGLLVQKDLGAVKIGAAHVLWHNRCLFCVGIRLCNGPLFSCRQDKITTTKRLVLLRLNRANLFR